MKAKIRMKDLEWQLKNENLQHISIKREILKDFKSIKNFICFIKHKRLNSRSENLLKNLRRKINVHSVLLSLLKNTEKRFDQDRNKKL